MKLDGVVKAFQFDANTGEGTIEMRGGTEFSFRTPPKVFSTVDNALRKGEYKVEFWSSGNILRLGLGEGKEARFRGIEFL